MNNFTSNSQKIGKLGEEIASKYLKKHGFSILERNYTRKWGEIDIVAQKDKTIYFVEVKSASCQKLPDFSDENPFRPEENINSWKKRRLAKTIETYLIHRRIGNTPWQFYIVLVFLDLKNRRAKVKTIENVVL